MKKLIIPALMLLNAFGAAAQLNEIILPEDWDFEIFSFGFYEQVPQFEKNGLHYSIKSVNPMEVSVMGPQILRLVCFDFADKKEGNCLEKFYTQAEPGTEAVSVNIPRYLSVTFTPAGQQQDNYTEYCYYEVTSISCATFANSPNLQSVTIPATVREIRAGAFYNCEKLEEVKFAHESEREMFSIRPNAFWKCQSLKSIDLSHLASAPYGAFDMCHSLEEIILRGDATVAVLRGRHLPSLKIVRALASEPEEYVAEYTPDEYPLKDPFFGQEYKNAVLIVPDGCRGAYETTLPWSNFENILTTSEYAAIEEDIASRETVLVVDNGGILSLASGVEYAELYSTDGRHLGTLSEANPTYRAQPGVIVAANDDKSQKVAVR